MVKGNTADNSGHSKPHLSGREATVTVRLSPITGKRKSIPPKDHKGFLPALSREGNTKGLFTRNFGEVGG